MSESTQIPGAVVESSSTLENVSSGATPHRKVVAAGIGAGFGVATGNLINGALGDMFYSGNAVPDYLSGWISIAVPGALALAAGYFTRRASNE